MPDHLWLVALPVAVGGGFLFLRWLAYLAFCAWVVARTGDAASLRHVAVAIKAFPRLSDVPLSLRPPGGGPPG